MRKKLPDFPHRPVRKPGRRLGANQPLKGKAGKAIDALARKVREGLEEVKYRSSHARPGPQRSGAKPFRRPHRPHAGVGGPQRETPSGKFPQKHVAESHEQAPHPQKHAEKPKELTQKVLDKPVFPPGWRARRGGFHHISLENNKK